MKDLGSIRVPRHPKQSILGGRHCLGTSNITHRSSFFYAEWFPRHRAFWPHFRFYFRIQRNFCYGSSALSQERFWQCLQVHLARHGQLLDSSSYGNRTTKGPARTDPSQVQVVPIGACITFPIRAGDNSSLGISFTELPCN